MWMGTYSFSNLLGILIQSIFIENFVLSLFLGMCTFLACSSRVQTANGLGLAVVFVLTFAGVLNWFLKTFVTAPGALSLIFGSAFSGIDLSFLQFMAFISVIAAFVQVLEMLIECFSPALWHALGSYLPLITVNCAILGACLWSINKDYPFIPNLVYVLGAGIGWWLAIALIAAVREKLRYSNVLPCLRGMGITFVMSGLMSMAFLGFSGIQLAKPAEDPSKSSGERSMIVQSFEKNQSLSNR